MIGPFSFYQYFFGRNGAFSNLRPSLLFIPMAVGEYFDSPPRQVQTRHTLSPHTTGGPPYPLQSGVNIASWQAHRLSFLSTTRHAFFARSLEKIREFSLLDGHFYHIISPFEGCRRRVRRRTKRVDAL